MIDGFALAFCRKKGIKCIPPPTGINQIIRCLAYKKLFTGNLFKKMPLIVFLISGFVFDPDFEAELKLCEDEAKEVISICFIFNTNI